MLGPSWVVDVVYFQGLRFFFITRAEFELLACGWLRPEDVLELKAKGR